MAHPICPAGMELRRGGEVQYDTDFSPRTVQVKDICVDEYPVTNIIYDLFSFHRYVVTMFKSVLAREEPPAYETFLSDNYRAPLGPLHPYAPVTSFYLHGAREYCAALGRRLPREEEAQHMLRMHHDSFITRARIEQNIGYLWRTDSSSATVNYRVGISTSDPSVIVRAADITEEHGGDAFGDSSFFCVTDIK